MAGGIGASIEPPPRLPAPPQAWLFGEDQGRYIIAVPATDAAAIEAAGARAPECRCRRIGRVGGGRVDASAASTPYRWQRCAAAHESWLPRFMSPDGRHRTEESRAWRWTPREIERLIKEATAGRAGDDRGPARRRRSLRGAQSSPPRSPARRGCSSTSSSTQALQGRNGNGAARAGADHHRSQR